MAMDEVSGFMVALDCLTAQGLGSVQQLERETDLIFAHSSQIALELGLD